MSARPVEVVDFVDPSRVGGVKRAREEGAAPRAPPSAPPLAPLPAGLSRKHHPTDRRSVFASVAALGASGAVVEGFDGGAFGDYRALGRTFKRWVASVQFVKAARAAEAAVAEARLAGALAAGAARAKRRAFRGLVAACIASRVARGQLAVALEHWAAVLARRAFRGWARATAAARPRPCLNPVAVAALLKWVALTLPDRGVFWKPGPGAALAARAHGVRLAPAPGDGGGSGGGDGAALLLPHCAPAAFASSAARWAVRAPRGVGGGGGGGGDASSDDENLEGRLRAPL